MSLKIDLDAADVDRILALVEDCYFAVLRGVDDEETCAALYVDASQGTDFEPVREVEFVCVDDLFAMIFDGFLAHAVRAREFAFTRTSQIERMMERDHLVSAQWLDNINAYPYNTEALRFSPKSLEDAIASEPYKDEHILKGKLKKSTLVKAKTDIEAKLKTLKVVCLSAPALKRPKGSYSEDVNQLIVWPFSQILTDAAGDWDLTAPSIKTYAALIGHTFLHELAHLLEPCHGVVSAVLKDRLIQRRLTSWMESYRIKEFLKDEFSKLSGYFGHCQRFRLALLYLGYKQKFVRKTMFEQIETYLTENPLFWRDPGEQALKKDGTPKVAGKYRRPVWVRPPSWGINEPDLSTKESEIQATYGWEKDLRADLIRKQEGRSPLYVPKSTVEMVGNLKQRLIELDSVERKLRRKLRRNFMRGPKEMLLDAQVGGRSVEGVLVSPQGFTNLYLADFEDPFELALEMVKSPRVIPLDNVHIDLDLPFLGLQLSSSSITPVYCDGAGEICTLTFEEFWWVLNL